MSELMHTQCAERNFRWQLLTTVSAFSLLAGVYGATETRAADEDADRPTVWLELGGQMDHVSGQGGAFAPAFLVANQASSVLQSPTPLRAQKPATFSLGEEGKITLQPESSGWIFSASARFGRSSDAAHVHHQTYKTFKTSSKYGVPDANENSRGINNFSDTHASHRESHGILEFSAGKDVGLGMFGREGASILSLGVRFAQFSSNATFDVRARPNLQFKTLPLPTFHATFHLPYFHTYHATGQASRNFHGVGPSLSWSNSTSLMGNSQSGEIIFDWGANAAVLFGKQKARARHQESAHYVTPFWVDRGGYYTAYQHAPAGHSNARSVIVPNVGGFAGASYRVENFKVSFGYRADFFFGAIDGGIDTPKSENSRLLRTICRDQRWTSVIGHWESKSVR